MNNILSTKMDSNVQIVCTLGDLRQLFADWRDEQKAKEQRELQQQKKEDYLTVDEVCKILGVTKPTLWRWAKMNYLVPVKVGKKNFYKASDLDLLRKG